MKLLLLHLILRMTFFWIGSADAIMMAVLKWIQNQIPDWIQCFLLHNHAFTCMFSPLVLKLQAFFLSVWLHRSQLATAYAGLHLLRERLQLSRQEEVEPTVNAAMFINKTGRNTRDSLASMLAFFCMGTSTLYSGVYNWQPMGQIQPSKGCEMACNDAEMINNFF